MSNIVINTVPETKNKNESKQIAVTINTILNLNNEKIVKMQD